MADFTQSKSYGTAVYPVHAYSTPELLRRAEPLLSPEKLASRFLKGITLRMRNGDSFSPEDIQDRINLAMNQAELELKTSLTRIAVQEKAPFDYNLYKSYIHTVTEWGPIISIEQLAIASADGTNIFEVPATWIETANFSKHLINVIPLLAAYGVNQVAGSVGNAGIAFLTVIEGLNWVPAYWQIKYTYGVSNKEGQVPVVINEYVGCIAAIAILSEIAANNIYNSQSQTQDGISQSSSGPGTRIYEKRIEDLEKKQALLAKKLRGVFSRQFFIGSF